MNEKIKPALPWINVSLIIIIIISLQYLSSDVFHLNSLNRWISTFYNLTIIPGLEILRYTTIETINWFGGSEYPFSEFVKSIAVTAAGFIVLFILAPWFFIRGFFHKSSEQHPSGLMWHLAAPVLILGIIVSTIHVVQVQLNTIYSANQKTIQSNRTADELQNYMISVAFDASEWWILPEKAGGGSGSFFINEDETSSLSLADLSSYDPEHPKFELTVEEIPSDSTMIIKGSTVKKDTETESEQNITLEITPTNDSLFKFL
ncbi:hypothetical protein [Rhodohalobacter sp.]|uniref:hypothetical protein n=1 Tax=Rhodohalobacter sp. TaxID=1974210 RepID=UPI002ACE0FFD|nr:hypothetical protein [Rhodohalobacter sp.]MDZ7756731.1 hypothetical protein [Rhodohalobacter sp.]